MTATADPFEEAAAEAARQQNQEALKLDMSEIQRFVELLAPGGATMTIQTFDDSRERKDPSLAVIRHGTLDGGLTELEKLQRRGAGIFVAVNETDGAGRKAENIRLVRAVYGDFDDGLPSHFPLQPSMIVESSPGKFQAYWLTADDWQADGRGKADFAAAMEGVLRLGADPGAKDVARVLRLPGSWHLKGKPHLVRIIEADGRRYTRASILEAFRLPPNERARANGHAHHDQRHSFGDGDEIGRIKDALRWVPADEREIWLKVGMALKAHFGDAGRPIWDAWSAVAADKFKERDQEKAWHSFQRDGIGIGTLFQTAKHHGWQPPRPNFGTGQGSSGAPHFGSGTSANGGTGNGGGHQREWRNSWRGNSQPSSPPILRHRRASSYTPEAVEWLWRGRIPQGKITLLAGDPGLGKSQLSAYIAAQISNGGKWPDGSQAPAGAVIFLSAEDGAADTIVPRLIACGANLERIEIIDAAIVKHEDGSEDIRTFSLRDDLGAMDKMLDGIGGAALIVIDPISSYMGRGTDTHNNSDVRSVLEPIKELAERRKTAALCITHLNKGNGGKAHQRFTGSGAFVAAARVAWLVAAEEDDGHPTGRHLLLRAKGNLSSDPGGLAYRIGGVILGDGHGLKAMIETSKIVWDKEPVHVKVDDVLEPKNGFKKESKEEAPALSSARDFLLDLLNDGPRAVEEIRDEAKAAGVGWRTVETAKAQLGILSKKAEGEGGKWFWRLSEAFDKTEQDRKAATPQGRNGPREDCGVADNECDYDKF